MNDFLQSLRNGNHKRFDGNSRKQYSNYNNRGNERPRGNSPLHRTINKEYWPFLKQVLEDVAAQQKRTADADERRAQAEERKADALEAIAQYVTHLIDPKAATAGETEPDLSTEAPESATVVKDAPEATTSTDQEKALKIIQEMRENRVSYEKIAAYLSAEDIPTLSGKGKWRGQTVSRIYQQNR